MTEKERDFEVPSVNKKFILKKIGLFFIALQKRGTVALYLGGSTSVSPKVDYFNMSSGHIPPFIFLDIPSEHVMKFNCNLDQTPVVLGFFSE